MIIVKRKIQEQIEMIKNPILYYAFQWEGHAIERHVLTDTQLFRALWTKPKPKYADDIVKVTRFVDKESALHFIADTLSKNIDNIAKWLLSDIRKDLVVTATFDEVTGDALVKNTNWQKTIPMHSTLVVLRKNYKVLSRSFVIVTAYPDSTLEDVDVIYDAMDEYISKKNQ